MMKKQGKVWLVGAGPGDAGLLTIKGRQAILDADVIVYDRLVGPEILALMPEQAECIDVGKQSNHHPVPQWRINEILLEKAQEGKLKAFREEKERKEIEELNKLAAAQEVSVNE